MSGNAWAWVGFAAYVVIGIGTWRYIFSEFYVAEVQRRQDRERQHQRQYGRIPDSLENIRAAAFKSGEVWVTSALLGLMWPLVAVVAVVWWPVSTFVRLFRAWFLRSAKRKADKEFA